jgi:hypothetical protein
LENSILNAIETYEASAQRGGELQKERAKEMDYYLGREFGNEVPNRSSVVSRDVADSIEWIKPGLLRVFTSGDDVVNFDPRGPEDIEQAQQETDFVNFIITQKNNWFNTAYVWFTDALIQKNGYVKAYWDERVETEKETYQGLTQDQFALIAQDPEVEILSAVTRVEEYPVQTPEGQMLQGVPVYDVIVQKKKTYGCAKFVNLPPERTIVSILHQEVDLENADFVEHWEYKSLSTLRQEGFEVPDDIGDDSGGEFSDEEEQSRDRFNEDPLVDSETNDPSMKRVKARECWLRYDEDGDGIAELRHCLVVGNNVLLNEEADFIPIASLTPRIMPHRHIGISVADAVMDIQLIKSTLQRAFLDNVFFAINGRHGVDKNKVNLEDMLTVRPAGIVRTDGSPHDSIMPITHQSDFGSVLTGIQYFDGVRAERTGSNKDAQQLSPDALAKLPSGIAIAQLQNAQQALTELTARVFAETGVKRLFRLIHALTLKHSRQAEVVRLRNKWVTVDPRNWKTRMDMTISVGLGTGNKEQQMMMLERIMQMQMGLLPLGLATRDTIHHTASKFTQAAGFKDKDAFWPDPKTTPPPPPQPDPKVQAEMAKLQLQAQAAQQDAMLERQKAQDELRMKQIETQAEIQLEREKAAAEIQLERERAAAQIEIEREKATAAATTKHMAEMTKAMRSPREKEVVRGKDGKVAKIVERSL